MIQQGVNVYSAIQMEWWDILRESIQHSEGSTAAQVWGQSPPHRKELLHFYKIKHEPSGEMSRGALSHSKLHMFKECVCHLLTEPVLPSNKVWAAVRHYNNGIKLNSIVLNVSEGKRISALDIQFPLGDCCLVNALGKRYIMKEITTTFLQYFLITYLLGLGQNIDTAIYRHPGSWLSLSICCWQYFRFLLERNWFKCVILSNQPKLRITS